MKNNKNIYIIILIIAILLIAYLIYGYYQKSTFELKNPIATMEIEDYGIVKIELYPEMANIAKQTNTPRNPPIVIGNPIDNSFFLNRFAFSQLATLLTSAFSCLIVSSKFLNIMFSFEFFWQYNIILSVRQTI